MATTGSPRHVRRRRSRTATVQRLALTGAAVVALTSCSQSDDGDGGADGGDESCPAIVMYAGAEYSQERAGEELERSKRLGKGIVPGCSDSNDGPAVDTKLDVWSLRGVAPDAAIGVDEGGTLALYIASSVDDVCAVKYTKCE